MTNSAWQLMATFVPNAVSRDLRLVATVGRSGARTTLSALPRIVSSGAATRGWTTESVSFGLASLPADGLYGGVITYALTLP